MLASRVPCPCRRLGRAWCAPAAALSAQTPGRTGAADAGEPDRARNGKPSFVVRFVRTDLGLIAGLIWVELATARTVKAGGRTRGRDIPIRDYWAILLDAGRPQPGEAVAINRTLPGEKFLDRQHIETAGLFE